MILENSRARLVPFSERAAENLSEIIFDQNIWSYMGHYITNHEDLNDYIKNTTQAQENQLAIPFLIVDKHYGALGGCSRFGKIDLNNKRAEIGWTWYGTKFQGTGLNSAAKELMLDYGFNQLGLQRIQLGADLRNIRSQKAIEKLGATREGIRRNHYVDSDGITQDDVYYSITKEDWLNHTNSHLNK